MVLVFLDPAARFSGRSSSCCGVGERFLPGFSVAGLLLSPASTMLSGSGSLAGDKSPESPASSSFSDAGEGFLTRLEVVVLVFIATQPRGLLLCGEASPDLSASASSGDGGEGCSARFSASDLLLSSSSSSEPSLPPLRPNSLESSVLGCRARRLAAMEARSMVEGRDLRFFQTIPLKPL
uniref:Uncharacterized protein n=1 Tax=Zea mays TaxID=4577 RepID=B6T8Q8_MAIZE|nr:hypothetical protein [Zea mays]